MFTLNMSDIFTKTEHGLTDILIARAEFKSVLNPEFFLGIILHMFTMY